MFTAEFEKTANHVKMPGLALPKAFKQAGKNRILQHPRPPGPNISTLPKIKEPGISRGSTQMVTKAGNV